MAAPRAMTIQSDVNKALEDWLKKASSYMDSQSFQFKFFLNSVDKLANADAYAASLARANVFHLTGNLEKSLYWIRNTRHLAPFRADTTISEAVFCSNLGYFSQAAACLATLKPAEQVQCVNILSLSACYPAIIALRKSHTEADDHFNEMVDYAERCQMTLEQINISPDVLQRVLTLAGEVLRKHRMFFAGEVPFVHAVDDCFLYELEVDVAPAAATRMTDEVIAMMVARDLDVPGLAFSFIGTKH